MRSLAEFVRSTPFFAIAHRGDSGAAPENTMAALRLALEQGVPMIELDVQRTADDELVVFHDDVLGRTTNGHGYIDQTTLRDVQQLDAGSWFDERYRGERIPRVVEALELLANRVYLNIELKPFGSNVEASMRDVQRLVQMVHHYGIVDTMAFSSFDHRTLALVKHLDGRIPTVALHVPGDARTPSQVVKACGANAWGCAVEELTLQAAHDARAHGIPYGVYTVNTHRELQAMLDLGVNAVVTNHPHHIMQYFHQQ